MPGGANASAYSFVILGILFLNIGLVSALSKHNVVINPSSTAHFYRSMPISMSPVRHTIIKAYDTQASLLQEHSAQTDQITEVII
jgi:hypothetical protein